MSCTEQLRDRVRKTAQRFPSRIAVEYPGHSLAYRDLERLSSLFANQLTTSGILPGAVVGIGLFNSPCLLIAILGTLKAGGIYLPLDPSYPPRRLRKMAEDSRTAVIVVDDQSHHVFRTFPEKKMQLDVDDLSGHALEPPTISPDQPAYIIYTSGSTGLPKGIVVSHASLLHAATSFARIKPQPTVSLLASSISFDPSILTIFHALYVGGTICLYDNRAGIDACDFDQVSSVIRDSGVDFILSTPSFYNRILGKHLQQPSLNDVFLCGENVSDQTIDGHIKLSPQCNLYNSYGPSEYAIGSTLAVIYDAQRRKRNPTTIGKPFSKNTVYVLDANLKTLPVGEKGEFFVGGPGLAIGYLGNPALTAQKFIVCEVNRRPTRLYRTGDIGYRLSNGEFVFCGRQDLQVKIHGHRVELEEIEATFIEHPDIDNAVVIPLNERLTLFYSTGLELLTTSDLVSFASERLPSYMVPEVFLQIENWPITTNGKIDRYGLADIYGKRKYEPL